MGRQDRKYAVNISYFDTHVTLLNCLSAFLRGSPGVVPHSSRQEGPTEAGATLLQERGARGGRSGAAGLPGKVTVAAAIRRLID